VFNQQVFNQQVFNQDVTQMDAETYRRKAEQYFTFAGQMRDPNAKAALIDLATHWMQMAKQSEGLDHHDQNIEAKQTSRSQVRRG